MTSKAVLVHTHMEPALAQQVTETLRAAGYDPRVLAPAGLSAVQEAVKGAHCVVLDEWIDGRSAFELVIHMKANPATREIPICLLCADPSNFTVSACRAAGVDRLVNTKSPGDMAQLKEAFRAIRAHGAPVLAALDQKAAGAISEAGISRRTLLKAAGAAAVGAAAIEMAASPAQAGTPQNAAPASPTPAAPVDPAALQNLPLIPIRDKVYFPGMAFPLFVGRPKTVRAVDEAQATGGVVFLVTQKQIEVDDPRPEELYEVGTVARVLELLHLPDGTIRVTVSSTARARITEYLQTEPCFRARVEPLPVEEDRSPEAAALIGRIAVQLQQKVDEGQQIPVGALAMTKSDEAGRVADLVTPFLPVPVEAQQEILTTASPRERLEKVSALLAASAP